MGSVIDYIDCPNCGYEAYCDFYYKTGEEYVNCQNCGYHYSATYKTDDKGKYITKDGTKNYAFDNLIMEIKELKNPYGAYRIKYNDSVAYQCGALENEDQLNEIHQQIGELIHTGVEVELFSINRFVDGEIVTIDIIDNEPKD
jgi:Zn ribbon nucleic-acid-binding protein